MHRVGLRSAAWRSRSLPVKRHPACAIPGIDITRPTSATSQSISGASDIPLTGRNSMVTDDSNRTGKGPSKASKALNYIGIILMIIGAIPLITGASRYVTPIESIIIGAIVIGAGFLLIFFVCWCTYVCDNVEERIPMRHPKIVDGLRRASIASNQEAFRRACVNSPKIVVEMVHEITDPLNSNYYSNSNNSIPNTIFDRNTLSPKKGPRSPRKCSL